MRIKKPITEIEITEKLKSVMNVLKKTVDLLPVQYKAGLVLDDARYEDNFVEFDKGNYVISFEEEVVNKKKVGNYLFKVTIFCQSYSYEDGYDCDEIEICTSVYPLDLVRKFLIAMATTMIDGACEAAAEMVSREEERKGESHES